MHQSETAKSERRLIIGTINAYLEDFRRFMPPMFALVIGSILLQIIFIELSPARDTLLRGFPPLHVELRRVITFQQSAINPGNWLSILLYSLLLIAYQAPFMVKMHRTVLFMGEEDTLAEKCGFNMGFRTFRYLGNFLLSLVLCTLSLIPIVMALVFFVVLTIAPAVAQGSLSHGMGIAAGITILLVVGIYGYFLSRFLLLLPAVAADAPGNFFQNLGRSWSLTKGNSFRFYFVGLLCWMTWIAAYLVLDAGGSYLVDSAVGSAEALVYHQMAKTTLWIVTVPFFLTVVTYAYRAFGGQLVSEEE